eukprot:2069772-Rhodomonas_salina.1
MGLLQYYINQGACFKPTLDLLVRKCDKELMFNTAYGRQISIFIKEITSDLGKALNHVIFCAPETVHTNLVEASVHIWEVSIQIPQLQEYKIRARES